MRFQSGPGPNARTDVVIVGGGIGGLATGLALARAGRQVILLERDNLPMRDDVEDAFHHPRSGAPQSRHTHGLLARLTNVLRERFPDVLDDLRARGAHEVTLGEELGGLPEDADLAVLLVRRSTLELVLREAVRRQPGIELRADTAVAGVLADPTTAPDEPPVVTGVQLFDRSAIEATTVIATTGRRSAVPAWLRAIGVDIPETEYPTHLLYLTRWYRDTEARELELNPKLAGDLGFVKYLAVPGDGHTFSVTIACSTHDAEMRAHLLDPAAFDDAARLLPGASEIFAAHKMEPISDVAPMGGLVNRLRSFLDRDGQPRVTGFHALGDAHTCTNPFYGRGCSLALVQATLLADAFIAHPDDATARVMAYERASAAEIEPWFHHAVMLDQAMGRQDSGDEADGENGGRERIAGLEALMAAAATDPVIARGIMRVFNLLQKPDELMTDAAFLERAMAIFADPASVPRPEISGPTRADLLAIRAA